MSSAEAIPPKKLGIIGSLFFAFFPALTLCFATAYLVETAVWFLPAKTEQATVIDRHTRLTLRSRNESPKTVYGMTLEFADGAQKSLSCPQNIYDSWPVGLIVQAKVFPALDRKVTSLTWQPDDQQRSEGHEPVTFTRSTAWWFALPGSLVLLVLTYLFGKEYLFSRKLIGSRPVFIIMLLMSILMGVGISTAW